MVALITLHLFTCLYAPMQELLLGDGANFTQQSQPS